MSILPKTIYPLSLINENENTTYQDLLDVTKEVFRGKFIALTAHITKEEGFKSMTSFYCNKAA